MLARNLAFKARFLYLRAPCRAMRPRGARGGQVERGEVDTVLLALTDMQGRLQGKRLTARHFVEEVAEHGAEGCNYLLAVDVEMNTGRRLRDGLLGARLRRLRHAARPGHAAAGALAGGHRDVPGRPRLGRRLGRGRLAAPGPARASSPAWPSAAGRANAGTELEFLVFRDTYEEAWHKGYRDLEPANLYNVDYSLLGTARVEPLIRRIRNAMGGAGLAVENSKGECNLGQHEINFRYADALRTADEHAIYKNAAKEIAAQEGMSITFMAKFNEREGSSCHIHFSLADDDGAVFDDRAAVRSVPGRPAGLPARADAAARAERQLLQALRRGLVRPHRGRLGPDNRTCALRVVGHGPGLRFENRAGGADLNPYLALTALIAAGLHGVDDELELEPAYEGNAYAPPTSRGCRRPCATPVTCSPPAASAARQAFGDEVVDHYVHAADVELAAFDAAVTDWERRGFERL